MKLEEFKNHLATQSEVKFQLSNGEFVPSHFHVTEVGQITRNFIDCGGTVRNEKKINFQLWVERDTEHRLTPEKLLTIIRVSEEKIGLSNSDLQVEYQGDTIGKFELDFRNNTFVLKPTFTDCLAGDKCGIPTVKNKVDLSSLSKNSCEPGSGCC